MHLENEHTKCPPVHCFPVPLVQYNLRGNILWSPADCEGTTFSQLLGKPEISKFKIPVIRKQQILWLQISENKVLLVKKLKTSGDNGGIEPCLFSRQRFHVAQIGKQFSTVD